MRRAAGSCSRDAEGGGEIRLLFPKASPEFLRATLHRAICSEPLAQSQLHRANCAELSYTESVAQSHLRRANFEQSYLHRATGYACMPAAAGPAAPPQVSADSAKTAYVRSVPSTQVEDMSRAHAILVEQWHNAESVHARAIICCARLAKAKPSVSQHYFARS